MFDWFDAAPGRLFVAAALLPLAAFALLLVGGAVKNLCRPFRQDRGTAWSAYWLLGGDRPLTVGAYLATAAMAGSAALAVAGLWLFLRDPAVGDASHVDYAGRWAERVEWVRLGPPTADAGPAALHLGYRVDHLSAVLFTMVAVVGTLIFVFSLGYMRDETGETVEDHEVDRQQQTPPPHPLPATERGDQTDGHHHPSPHRGGAGGGVSGFSRRGRYGRFFLYLSLFAFSMFNLVLADNLFQVFVGWELVGVSSFFLIGFYTERPSAGRAAVKAFVVNRIGDAGLLVGLLIAWTSLGTLNFEEMTRRVQPHGQPLAHNGGRLILWPAASDGWQPEPTGTMPYTLFVLMGAGIFLGCVGKSAQIPLQTWLPDAMEGPTPVSALIHAATMVAAGVYLVGRAFPLFAPEVLLGIAYIGCVTLFVSATIALVQTDIKRVLAYSTCSQLGFMMLALGVGGWVAGLLHLLTHAFFKALLFLGAGSVIHGCHHEQDLRQMGGLLGRMRLTAVTMLVGVLAISGFPLLSGWYSKDMVLAAAVGYAAEHPAHLALAVLPLLTAGLTAFYMFRLWFLAFVGTARGDAASHAHESPAVMVLPLVVLAAFSVGVAWGWPLWNAEASELGHLLERAEPEAVAAGFHAERHAAHEYHLLAGGMALAAAAAGAGLAAAMYWRPRIDPAAVRAKAGGLHKFLLRRWYFDEAYDTMVVRPAVGLAFAAAAADKRPTDADEAARPFDLGTLDGLQNAVGQGADAAGRGLGGVQTGRLRGYVLALVLTVVVLLGMLWGLRV